MTSDRIHLDLRKPVNFELFDEIVGVRSNDDHTLWVDVSRSPNIAMRFTEGEWGLIASALVNLREGSTSQATRTQAAELARQLLAYKAHRIAFDAARRAG